MSLLELGSERPRGGMEVAALKAHRRLQGQTTGAKERAAQRLTRTARPSRLLARAVASIKSRQPSSPAESAAWWGVRPAARGRLVGKSASPRKVGGAPTTLRVVTKATLEASAQTQAAQSVLSPERDTRTGAFSRRQRLQEFAHQTLAFPPVTCATCIALHGVCVGIWEPAYVIRMGHRRYAAACVCCYLASSCRLPKAPDTDTCILGRDHSQTTSFLLH